MCYTVKWLRSLSHILVKVLNSLHGHFNAFYSQLLLYNQKKRKRTLRWKRGRGMGREWAPTVSWPASVFQVSAVWGCHHRSALRSILRVEDAALVGSVNSWWFHFLSSGHMFCGLVFFSYGFSNREYKVYFTLWSLLLEWPHLLFMTL